MRSLLWAAVAGCAAPPPGATLPDAAPSLSSDLRGRALSAPGPSIPPACYARTDGRNTCHTCHNRALPPNFVERPDLQIVAAFPAPAATNPWTNLFVDRAPAIARVTDDAIAAYVRVDNYHDADGKIRLARVLTKPPPGWDADGDGAWGGWVPDVAFRADARGVDQGADGPTGWWLYRFAPFPGAFFPTNGSMGDAWIRLPVAFRTDAAGRDDVEVYATNLAILEAMVKQADVLIAPTDEGRLGVDLDQDGALGTATRVAYRWGVRQPRVMSWVGAAKDALARGEVQLAGGLYPEGTEIAHSVRYLDVVDGQTRMAARMKELRYLRKSAWLSYPELQERARTGLLEEIANPDALDARYGDVERGLGTGRGWTVQGFIEDEAGALRPQTFEETAYCVGCHGGTSAGQDGVYSFGRRSPYAAAALPEPIRGDGRGEYAVFLEAARGLDDFAANPDNAALFADGRLRPEVVASLAVDAAPTLTPGPARAWALDKAYREIVLEQSFARGRDAVWGLTDAQAWREVPEDQPTGVTTPVAPAWMRP